MQAGGLGNWTLNIRGEQHDGAANGVQVGAAQQGDIGPAGAANAHKDMSGESPVVGSIRAKRPAARRNGNDHIAMSLRHAYDSALNEDVPASLTDLLQQLR